MVLPLDKYFRLRSFFADDLLFCPVMVMSLRDVVSLLGIIVVNMDVDWRVLAGLDQAVVLPVVGVPHIGLPMNPLHIRGATLHALQLSAMHVLLLLLGVAGLHAGSLLALGLGLPAWELGPGDLLVGVNTAHILNERAEHRDNGGGVLRAEGGHPGLAEWAAGAAAGEGRAAGHWGCLLPGV
jgi:hypothetical protein